MIKYFLVKKENKVRLISESKIKFDKKKFNNIYREYITCKNL